MARGNRLPSACPQDRGWTEAGLVTYTENYSAAMQGTGATIVKVLRGTKPADIPFEQPASSFKLIINTRTAKALDITWENSDTLKIEADAGSRQSHRQSRLSTSVAKVQLRSV